MTRSFNLRLLLLTLALMTLSPPVAAQSIREADDGVGSTVQQRGRRYDIDGGSRSRNGRNLFHSFERFGLEQGEIANFLSDPQVRNILGRVTGGDASIVDGLLRVSGGEANLFLINPAGVLFGENARLDLSGDFTATTATGIGFEGGDFPAVGDANYSALVGDPSSFAFSEDSPGAVANRGDLAIAPGHALTLLGGQVINTGTLTAPGGTLTVAAVEGGSRVRINQAGMLLGLELETQTETQLGPGNPVPFNPLSLPELLTGGGVTSASEVTVAADGTIRLSGGTAVPSAPGTAIAAGTLDASDPSRSTAQINVVGDRVVVADALLDASGRDGGTVRVGGDVGGAGSIPNASDTRVTADSTIQADALQSGDGGTVVVWSDVSATVAGELTARGGPAGGDGGFIETSGRQTLTLSTTPDASALNGSGGTWLIDPTNITIVSGTDGAIGTNQVGAENISTALNAGTSVTITTDIGGEEEGNITQNADAAIAKTAGADAALTITAANDVELLGGITATSGELDIAITGDADRNGGGAVTVGSELLSNGGDITISSPVITELSAVDAGTGDIVLQADSLPDLNSLTGDTLQLQSTDPEAPISLEQVNSVTGFSNLLVGGPSVNAPIIAEDDLTFTVPLTLQTSGPAVFAFAGEGEEPLTLTGPGLIVTASEIDAPSGLAATATVGDIALNTPVITGNLSLNAANNINLASDTINGDLDLEATNDINLASATGAEPEAVTIAPITAVELTAGDNINLANGLLFTTNALALPEGERGTISIEANADGANVGDVTLGGDLVANGGQNLVISGVNIALGNIQVGDFRVGDFRSPEDITRPAGDVTLTAEDDLTVASIESRANAGTTAGGSVTLSSGGNTDVTGDILVEADTSNPVEILEGGDVTIRAGGNVAVAGNISTFARRNTPGEGAELALTAGDVEITALDGDVTIDGQIAASVLGLEGQTFTGAGGTVTIDADSLEIRNDADAGSAVQAEAVNASATDGLGNPGSGGAIALRAPSGIDITGNLVTSNATITLTGPATLTGTGGVTQGGLPATVGNQGSAGAIAFDGPVTAPNGLTVNAGSGDITFGGDVDAASPAGDLSLFSSGVTRFNGDVSVTRLFTDLAGDVDLGANRTLTVDTLDLQAEEITGSGDLTIRPLSPERDIFLTTGAEAADGALTLTGDLIDQPSPPFTSLTVGAADSTGDIILSRATGFFIPITIAGGDRLIGPDQDTTYRFLGETQGSIDLPDAADAAANAPVTFENIDRVIGGGGDDTFTQVNNFTGAVVGGAGDDTFTRINNFTGRINGGEGSDTAIARAGGNLTLASLTPLVSIEQIDGNGSTLVGTDGADTFTILARQEPDTSEALATDVVAQDLTIQNLAGVDGRAGDDSFQIDDSVRVLMGADLGDFALRGGAGQDELDYSRFDDGLTLDLTAVPESIELITGTRADDTVILGSVFNSSVFGGRIDGGEGTLTLRGGTLDLSELDIFSQGPLEITGSGAVTLGDLRNPGRSITVSGSAITAGSLNTRSPRGSSLEGGAISLTAGTTAETGDLLTSGSSGGDVTVQATTSITTGRIDTSGRGGDGGDLLLDPEDDIEVVSINAQGGPAGTGGDIEITTETFFRATGDFIDRSSVRTSISASGGDGGGDITITHGGDDTTPFTIGVDGELENGTAAAIVSNGDQLGAPQSFLGDRVEGNIRIETGDPPAPPVSPGPPDPPELPEGPCPPDCDPVLQPLSTTRAEPGSQRPLVTEASTSLADIASAVTELEDQVTAEFSAHLGLDQTPAPISLGSIIATLQDVQKEAGITPAILYATFSEQTSAMAEDSTEATGIETAASLGNRRLELILITADARPVHIQVPEATQAQVQTAAARLRRQVSIPSRVGTTAYQASAQQLHRWLIDPIEATLAAQGIDTLGIVTDAGLRSLPFAALYNGDSFLVERYALTLVPSLTLTYLEYQNLQQSDALLGGTSSFANQAPLPFVPLELNRIQALWDGERFQGENFTRKALREQVQQDYDIIHLATHGEFQPGNISNSYIQFSDGRLAVDALQQLEWQPENIRLVTLSACQTALGNREAELGFAGLAVSAGAQTALASLWSVSDAATTGLMTNFYENLRTQSTKANALRDAQRAMIAGDLSLSSTLAAELDNLPLSVDINLSEDDVSFRHPYYWSAFTLVGSPW